MTDVHDAATRSRNMSAIRSRNTKPELRIRQLLHAEGFRFRLHVRDLPGCPDLVLPKFHAVIFVHGCFWHGHDCAAFRLPASRTEFWSEKIAANVSRDKTVQIQLRHQGWRTATLWECCLRGPGRLEPDQLLQDLSAWLTSDEHELILGERSKSYTTQAAVTKHKHNKKTQT